MDNKSCTNKYNIHYSVKPINSICALIGIRKWINNNKFFRSIHSIYCIFVSMMTFAVSVYFLFQNYVGTGKKPTWKNLLSFLLEIIMFISVMSSLILSIVHHKTHKEFVNNLKHVGRHLEIPGIVFVKYRKNIIKVLVVWFVYYGTFVFINGLTWIKTEDNIQTVPSAFDIIVVSITTISYIIEIVIVMNHAKIIREYLKLAYWANFPGKCENDQFSHISKMSNLFIDKKFWSFKNVSLFKLLSSYEKVICNIKLINNIYGVQVKIIRFKNSF